ncbi:hypothetical protein K474DRAFT_1584763 [Panus rudis PR-1116 ss-1]|nr:hypothetical protein K474DRAFT_1584763 [Panus rudis PR-1116 ss-1]
MQRAYTICRSQTKRTTVRAIQRWIHVRAHKAHKDLLFYDAFFSEREQRLLLTAALQKLDSAERRLYRQRRKEYLKGHASTTGTPSITDLFLPDEYYDFEAGHFDGVIKRFREMHVSSWPQSIPELPNILKRLAEIHPDEPTQTHILHLASDGEILPHVDNIEASGSWILGVSLGSPRVLRLENVEDPTDVKEITLPSGSVYLQRDSMRYGYKHSILAGRPFEGKETCKGQRLSIMIRVSGIQSDLRTPHRCAEFRTAYNRIIHMFPAD